MVETYSTPYNTQGNVEIAMSFAIFIKDFLVFIIKIRAVATINFKVCVTKKTLIRQAESLET